MFYDATYQSWRSTNREARIVKQHKFHRGQSRDMAEKQMAYRSRQTTTGYLGQQALSGRGEEVTARVKTVGDETREGNSFGPQEDKELTGCIPSLYPPTQPQPRTLFTLCLRNGLPQGIFTNSL
uniref:Uncharacterized protein n=1 Tax=Steinernema glaseri TaxID=37863 RepID=A0A1I7YU28_9BILA